MIRLIPLLLVLLCSAAIAQNAPTTPTTKPATRVLFIGNSYTAYNGGLPKVLKQMADHAGKPIEIEMSVSGGKSLEWHWNEGQARPAIERGGWDYVVLQDFSTQAINKPQLLAEYARKFDELITKRGAKTVFYLTWARQHQPENQAVITKAYTDAATELMATVAPVGVAWQRVLRDKPDTVLHFDDRSHPNPAGTYLTACVFYVTLLKDPPPTFVPPISNQRTGDRDQLPAEQAAYLRQVAIETASAAPASQPSRR
jgi:hypothetical protein